MRILLGIAAAAGLVWYLTRRGGVSPQEATERECPPGTDKTADGRCQEVVPSQRGGHPEDCIAKGTCYSCESTPPDAPTGKKWTCRNGLWKLITARDDQADIWTVPSATSYVAPIAEPTPADLWAAPTTTRNAQAAPAEPTYVESAEWIG